MFGDESLSKEYVSSPVDIFKFKLGLPQTSHAGMVMAVGFSSLLSWRIYSRHNQMVTMMIALVRSEIVP